MKIGLFPHALIGVVAGFAMRAQAETTEGPYVGVTGGWRRP
jgi:hypothetical protein